MPEAPIPKPTTAPNTADQVRSKLGNFAAQSRDEKLLPIGERIPLNNGAVLERPNPKLIADLQRKDSRIKYFPADLEAAQSASMAYSYYRSVVDRLGDQVRADFPDTAVYVRGTLATLQTSYPFWGDHSAEEGSNMNTVLDILASGSDNGRDQVRVGDIKEDGKLNVETQEWLNNHYQSAMFEVDDVNDRDQTFPILLVYKPEAFAQQPSGRWNDLTGEPSKRVCAVYITDKVVYL